MAIDKDEIGIFEHNLAEQDATAYADLLAGMGLVAYIIDQTEPHKVCGCEKCIKDAEDMYNEIHAIDIEESFDEGGEGGE